MPMRIRLAGSLLMCGLAAPGRIRAQGADPDLKGEVAAVRELVARSITALHQYTWTEQTEVLMGGSLKSSKTLACRYEPSGELTKTPIDTAKEDQAARSVSRRAVVRAKADDQDYIRRAISCIHNYVPLKPSQLQYLLENGFASLGALQAGVSELRFANYFERGDSLVFTYDAVSKVLLRAHVAATLGNPKDPVTMDVEFETLPGGINHVTSATLNAKRRNVQVKLRNAEYRKTGD